MSRIVRRPRTKRKPRDLSHRILDRNGRQIGFVWDMSAIRLKDRP